MRRLLFLLLIIAGPLWSRGLEFEKMSHDFGKMLQHKTAVWKVAFTNTTDKTIKLTEVKASCGCTVPIPEKKVLAPGETTKLVVRFDSGFFEGPQEKPIYIKTDEADKYLIFKVETDDNLLRALSIGVTHRSIQFL